MITKSGKSDKIFLSIVGIFVLIGFFVLASASMSLLAKKGSGLYGVMLRQVLFGIVGGGILFLITSKIDYKKWKKYSLPFFIAAFLLTMTVFLPVVGWRAGGAARWINLGFTTFQPSELLKFAFVVYISAWISTRKSDLQTFKYGFLPFVAITGLVSMALILQPDVGTLGVIAITGLALFFIGGGRPVQAGYMILLGMALLSILIYIAPYRLDRLTTFLDPSKDTTGIGYHLKQSIISIGSGGISGKGFGMSLQKFQYLPESSGDSIFSVFGEEFGFIGSFALIGLFLFLLYRGFVIAMSSPDDFSRLLASGIVILIVIQAFINIGAMIGILPLTGIPLTFISKGGSSLAITLAEIGVLINISKRSNQ